MGCSDILSVIRCIGNVIISAVLVISLVTPQSAFAYTEDEIAISDIETSELQENIHEPSASESEVLERIEGVLDQSDPAVVMATPEAQTMIEEMVVIEEPLPDEPDDGETLLPAITEVQVSGTCSEGVCNGNNAEFIEIYNPNSIPLEMSGMKLRYHGGGTSPQEYDLVDLNGVVLAPGELAVFGRNMSMPVKKAFTRALADSAGAVRLVRGSSMELIDQVGWGAVSQSYYTKAAVAPPTNTSIQRCFIDGRLTTEEVRDTSVEFVNYKNELPTPGVALACPVPDPPIPANQCEGLVLSEIAANVDKQFIELHNSSADALDISGCRLQTNRSAAFYELPAVEIMAGEYVALYISDIGLTLTKTTTGTVYLLSSDGHAEIDSQSYSKLAVGTAWAFFDDDRWLQTYQLTPGEANVYLQFLPCEVGYERNSETGRCRKNVVEAALADCGIGKYRSEETGRCRNIAIEATLTPCREGQYRSPDTNRCRNIATSTSSLTPCKPGQERNPETNRCRSTAIKASSLKPCAPGQERNPDTNRCRKVVSGDASAGFKVVDDEAGADKIASWLALGGVGMLALGYAGWEWRREVYGLLAKVYGALPFGK